MATTRIIPMHKNSGRSLIRCLEERTDYAENPEKTEGGLLVSSFACDPKTAPAEFALAKREYRERTGRVQARDIIAYQVRQSFKPGEITPQEANAVGVEFARRFTKENHAFLVCTHTDKAHIHNHIIWNSTALDCTRKFQNFWGSTQAVRRLSDLICKEHQLSVVENPKGRGMSYDKWQGRPREPSQRDQLRRAIDAALRKGPGDFSRFLRYLEEAGYTAVPGKHLAFAHPGQKKNIRLSSLGDGYSEEVLRAVVKGRRSHRPSGRKFSSSAGLRPTLLSEIEAKMHAGKGPGYEQWARVFHLKQMAKTILYLEEHGLTDYESVVAAADASRAQFQSLREKIRSAEARMAQIQTLRNHILNYIKTRDTYIAYRKSGCSGTFREAHWEELLLHKAAKEAFDALGLQKLPTLRSLNEEFSALLAEKKSAYAAYRQARADLQELEIHRKNIALILEKETPEPPRRHPPQKEK